MNRDMRLEYVDCPVCGPSRTRVWLEDGKPTRYLRCLECGTIYASPRASRSSRYAWLDGRYSVNANVFDLMNPRRDALKLESAMIQNHLKGGRMLDIGCSIGYFFEFFEPTSWERYGVELSPSAAEYSAQKYNCQVKSGTLQNAAYDDGYFDLVSLIDTIYYLDDPAGELCEVNRILKPGGWLAVELAGQMYIHMRNYGFIPLFLDRRWSRASTDSSYIYWFNPPGLQRLLNKCGYKVEAWYVIPSPRHPNKFYQLLTNIHYKSAKLLAVGSYKTLTWAPKYLCLARSNE